MRKTINFQTACKVLGISEDLPVVVKLPEAYQQEITDKYKMQVISDAINKENDNWQADYDNCDQYKYRPYFWKEKSGVGFSAGGYAYWDSYTCVGSRLCFGTASDAKYAGELFIKEGFII